jgi:Flagellar hook-length control protein FliK
MDIKLPPSSGPSGPNTATPTTTELPASLQQLPRGTLLTAVVQSSTPVQTQNQTQPTTPQNSPLSPTSNQAQATSAGTTQNRAFNVLLNISGHQVQTQSNYAFSAGQLLKVEITANAALRVVEVANKTLPLDQTLVQLQQGLRQALPLQQSPKLLLNNLAPLFQLLELAPASQAKTQIRELLATIPDLKQLSNPTTLKNSVSQSGIFLEAKIKLIQGQIQQLLQNNSSQNNQGKQVSSSLNQSTTNYSAPGRNQSTNPQQSSQQNSTSRTVEARELLQTLLRDNPKLNQQLERVIGQDFKAQLLKLSSTLLPLLANANNTAAGTNPAETALLQRILQVLPDTRGATTPGSGLNSLSLSNLPINTQLPHLLNPNLTTAQAQQQATNPSNNLDLAVSTVLRQIAASLAQVQASQLQSMVAPRADGDGGQLLNSWNIEIPVFLEGQFKPIQLHINEERHPDTSAQDNEQRRVWKITLGFDFEELGEFFATLRIIDTSISATFWSDRPETLQRITSELQHLSKSLNKLGLNVEELECRHGKPSVRETRLDRQLVDIKT